MTEPTIWMQLGISDDRYNVISKEIASILKTKETTGNMMLMVKASEKMSDDEKYYAVYMIAKEDIFKKLMDAMPPFARPVIQSIMRK